MPDPQRPPARRLRDFRVGEWLAEPALNRLTSGQTVLRMRPQLMDVLMCLARHQGKTVLKDDLLAEVWPDRFVTESGMVRCIAELRQLLGDDPREPHYVETIAKRGYRLIAAVTWFETETGSAADAGHDAGIEAGTRTAASDDEDGRATGEAADGEAIGTSRAAPPAGILATWGWRRWLAVAAALCLLAVSATVTIVLTRRASAAVLTDRDAVVLAFENTTGERVFDDTLPLALAIHLEQSPFLQIVPAEKVRQTLGLMKRPPDAPVTRALGMEICERIGATGLIVGSVTPIGRNYVIGLEAVACPTGAAIARQQLEVTSKDAVLGGLGRAASELRRAVGESLASIQAYGVPITEATTASLEALRALRQGDGARDHGQYAEALQFYREAATRDPGFALAQARLGAYALSLHYEPEGVAALERAFALRDRVTFPERLEIELIYHAWLTGDQNKITEALETMRRAYPRRPATRRRLSNHYLNIGRFSDALVEALEARKLEPASSLPFLAVARVQLALNRWADVTQTIGRSIAQGLDDEVQHSQLLQVGLIIGDAQLIARERAWAVGHPEATPYFLEIEAEAAVWRGGKIFP